MNILLCRFFVIDCMVLLYMWCTDDMSTVGFDILSGYKLGPCLNHLLCVTWWHNVSSLLSFQYLHWLISILVDAKPECICKNGYVIGAFFYLFQLFMTQLIETWVQCYKTFAIERFMTISWTLPGKMFKPPYISTRQDIRKYASRCHVYKTGSYRYIKIQYVSLIRGCDWIDYFLFQVLTVSCTIVAQ